jgi:hypothetical protein
MMTTIYRFMKTASLFAILICSAFFSLAQFQIINYEDPRMGEPKCIVFEQSEVDSTHGGKNWKVFDINENNPMKKYAFTAKTDSPYQTEFTIYAPTHEQARAYLADVGLPTDMTLPEVDILSASAFGAVYESENNVCVTYISSLNWDYENMEATRSSDVIVFDKKGNEILRLEKLSYDISETAISADGKYMAYLRGSLGAHTRFEASPGFVIHDLLKNQVYYEVEMHVSAARSEGNQILVSGHHSDLKRVYIMYTDDGSIYQKDYELPYPAVWFHDNLSIKETSTGKGEIFVNINTLNKIK